MDTLSEEEAGGWGSEQKVRERCCDGKEKKKGVECREKEGEERRDETRKGGHGRCWRKKRHWYKREEVRRKSKTARKSGTKGDAEHSTGQGDRGGLKEGSGDRDERTEREGERCFRHLKPAVGGTDPL